MPTNHAVQLHEEMNATLDAIKLDETDGSSDRLMNVFKQIDDLPLDGREEAHTKLGAFFQQMEIAFGEESGLDFDEARRALRMLKP